MLSFEAKCKKLKKVKIREKIKSLDFKDVYTRVAQLDAFMTIGNGICIQVAGEITNKQVSFRLRDISG